MPSLTIIAKPYIPLEPSCLKIQLNYFIGFKSIVLDMRLIGFEGDGISFFSPFSALGGTFRSLYLIPILAAILTGVRTTAKYNRKSFIWLIKNKPPQRTVQIYCRYSL